MYVRARRITVSKLSYKILWKNQMPDLTNRLLLLEGGRGKGEGERKEGERKEKGGTRGRRDEVGERRDERKEG